MCDPQLSEDEDRRQGRLTRLDYVSIAIAVVTVLVITYVVT
jgi:hypothetical protein